MFVRRVVMFYVQCLVNAIYYKNTFERKMSTDCRLVGYYLIVL